MEAGDSSPPPEETPPAGTDDANTAGRWWTLVVPVVVAVVTAAVGVGLTQWVEGCDEASEAENTARVLEQNLHAAEDALARSMADGRYRFYNLEVNIPLDDQKRLAAELGDDYEHVAAAASAYSLQFARADEEHAFVQDDNVQLACAMKTVARGRLALTELTATPEEAVTRDIRDDAMACRTETVQAVAQQFYDFYVDGNGPLACQDVYGKARETLQKRSPSCDEVVGREEHAPHSHPHAEAVVVPPVAARSMNVELQAVTGGSVGSLVMTDEDGDNAWHIDEIRNLKTVPLPQERGQSEASR